MNRPILGSAFVGIAGSILLFCAAPAQEPQSLQLVFGKDSGLEVKSGAFTVVTGPKTGPVLTATEKVVVALESRSPQAGPRVLRALLRLRTEDAPSATASLYLARTDVKSPGYRFGLSTSRGADAISCQVSYQNKPLNDAAALGEKLGWVPEVHNGLAYYPRAYPLKEIRPGWPEDYRLRIEYDMSRLPDASDKWLDVRVELRPDEVRFWVDDRLVARKSGSDLPIDGLTRLELSPGVQLADFAVTPWKPTPGFEPVRLDGYNNGRAFLGAATVKPGTLSAGEPVMVDGVPFVLAGLNPEGNDHIDVSKSLFREANLEGYLPANGHRFAGASRRDPARLQLRVPNGKYDRLYLLAAADGRPNSVPLVSAQFYRPGAGFAHSFEAEVPLATAMASTAKGFPVTLSDGKQVTLWRIELVLDPGLLSSFSDLDIVEVELTKKVHQYRSYPDPFIYGWHPAGLPSSVHVYAATLGHAPVGFTFEPDKFGHVWTAPEVPSYTATLTNHSGARVAGELTVTTRSYDGTEETSHGRSRILDKDQTIPTKVELPVKLNGYHEVTATLEIAGRKWTEKRSFVRLAPDTRSPRWDGKGALFGYWSYHGGHYTPRSEHHIELMTRAGARTSIGSSAKDAALDLVKKHWTRVQAGAWEVSPQPWALEEPVDPKKYAEYQDYVIKTYTKAREQVPENLRPDHVYFFPEPHVSQRLTEGNYPEYWNGEPYKYTDEEQKRLRMFMVTAKCAAEAIRKQWPELKILIPWGDALFAVPLLRAGFPRNLIDGSGIDTPGFERLPEMQLHQISVHRLYELRKEYEKAGIKDPQLQYNEGIFVPTEPGAVSWREQMDLYNRWVLISMAYGVKRFYSGWFAFDCGNYYGAEHYGGCGIQRRIPYCDPKPAYAAYATMTDRLDQADFDGWVKTGSLTTYCLRFKGPRGPIYTLWTLRGQRPVTLTLAADGAVQVTDAMNNTKVLKSQNRQVTVNTDASVVYVSGAEVVSAAAGEPNHNDVKPAATAKQVADLGDGTWQFTSKRDELYEKGTFAVMRYPGKFSASIVADPAHGKVLKSTLEKQETVHELMPWYNILAPKKPIVLPGAPSHLGLWVKGTSDWGRVVYTLRDAKGERWTSIGYQDQYNCDDVHSWSAFNFDDWRYVRFELPGHTGYDNFRKHGTTWWRSDNGDGVVDLPLTLESITVEQRSHILYVNDVQPATSDSVLLGKLFVEYASADDAAPNAVALSKLRMPPPTGNLNLPNPIAEMEKTGVGDPATLVKLEPPLERDDGTTIFVHFQPKDGAAKHFIWVGVRPDGRGAVNMTPAGAKDGVHLHGLRPALPFYFWVTYQDAQGKMSKPSPALTATLVDRFKEK